MRLTNEQWEEIKPFFPENEAQEKSSGRPWQPLKEVVEGVLWVLKTGARWKDLPKQYPSYQTCHRRFQKWIQSDVLFRALQGLVLHLKERTGLNLEETFIDAAYVDAQKGGPKLAQARKEMGPRSWPSRTIDLFLSPYPLRVLHLMRVNSLIKHFGPGIAATFLGDLSGTRHTILISSTSIWSDIMGLSSSLPIAQIEKSQLKIDELFEDTNDDGL